MAQLGSLSSGPLTNPRSNNGPMLQSPPDFAGEGSVSSPTRVAISMAQLLSGNWPEISTPSQTGLSLGVLTNGDWLLLNERMLPRQKPLLFITVFTIFISIIFYFLETI